MRMPQHQTNSSLLNFATWSNYFGGGGPAAGALGAGGAVSPLVVRLVNRQPSFVLTRLSV